MRQRDANEQSQQAKQSRTSSFTCPLEPCHLSIVIIGDSLSKYMYFSLAYFLRHNSWINPNHPNMIAPEVKISCLDWFNLTTRELAPFESCDCYRRDGHSNIPFVRNSVVENRYYFDPHRNNTVVYFQAFGNHVPMRGHWDNPQQVLQALRPPTAERNASMMSHLQNSHTPFTWINDWAPTIRDQVAKIRPHALVLNAGIWPHDFGSPQFLEDVVSATQEAGIERVIWRTTTAYRKGGHPSGRVLPEWVQTDTAMCKREEVECLNVTGWTSKVPSPFYIDKLHFREPIYQNMNQQLLELLGVSLGRNESFNMEHWSSR